MTAYLSAPSQGNITAPWGAPPATPTSPARHLGTDRGWGNGETIVAMRDGTVSRTAADGSYGNRTVIDHGVVAGRRWETWYCHQSRFLVTPGQVVRRGQPIGIQGATGNVTAKHLHSELRIDGVSHDEVPWQHTTEPGTTRRRTMFLIWDTNGTGYLVTPNGRLALPTMQVYNLFKRLIESEQSAPKPETFNPQEVQIIDDHLKTLARQAR